jgi:hypothetical protein
MLTRESRATRELGPQFNKQKKTNADANHDQGAPPDARVAASSSRAI